MNVLQINSSIYAESSVSSLIAGELSQALVTEQGVVVQRDVNKGQIPNLSAETHAAFSVSTDKRSSEEQAAVALSDTLIAELRASDVIVLAVPLYNFGIPSELKAWFDHIARAGETFQYTSEGPKGLLTDKRLIVVSSRGGKYAGTERDLQTQSLQQFFAFIGLTPEFIFVEGTAMRDFKDVAIDNARQEIAALVAKLSI